MEYISALFTVSDIQIAKHFYQNILGQKIKYDFGEKIVFQRFDGGSNGYGLYIVNPDGSDYKVLIDTPGNEQTPHWR